MSKGLPVGVEGPVIVEGAPVVVEGPPVSVEGSPIDVYQPVIFVVDKSIIYATLKLTLVIFKNTTNFQFFYKVSNLIILS